MEITKQFWDNFTEKNHFLIFVKSTIQKSMLNWTSSRHLQMERHTWQSESYAELLIHPILSKKKRKSNTLST